MLRYLLILVAAMVPWSSVCRAQPALDATTNPYIQLVSTDKGKYKPGQAGNMVITLRNPNSTTFSGTITTEIYLGSTITGFTGNTAVSISPNSTAYATVPFFFNTDNRGYHVSIILKNDSNVEIERAMGSIDIQSDTIARFAPRQCWVSEYPQDLNTQELVDSQVAWRCNSIQFYDAYYRPEMAPNPSISQWPSLANHIVYRSTLNSLISDVHEAGMSAGFFQATGEAYNTFRDFEISPSLKWGSFLNQCGLENTCTEHDLDRSPPGTDGWAGFGWQADHLDFFDPCNPGWQQFLLSKSIKPMMDQFDFDWWQADTVGEPVGPTYDYRGQRIDTSRCLSQFTSGAQKRIGKPVILNNVSGWGLVSSAQNGTQPYLYRQTWDSDRAYYPDLNTIVSGSNYGVRRYDNRAIIQPAYINRDLASGCSSGSIVIGCETNKNAALLATAMFAISGSYYMNHQNDACIMTNVYVPGFHLECSASTIGSLIKYKNFEVAYQNFLRDSTSDGSEPCDIVSGAVGGTSGSANQIYMIGKTRPGFQICHLLNLTGVSSNDWTDLSGTKETPTTIGTINLKMYYYGSVVTPNSQKLWWASPDYNNGHATYLDYVAGNDSGGNYVTFSIPSLSYWNMVVLETNNTGIDLNMSASRRIRGSWLDQNSTASNISQAATGANGQYARYSKVDFGSTAPTQWSLTYTSQVPTSITLKIDSTQGRLLSTCYLSAGYNVVQLCDILPTTGVHDIIVEFTKPTQISGFVFN